MWSLTFQQATCYSSHRGWSLKNRKGGQAPKQNTVQATASVTFAIFPLAKARYVSKPRVGGRCPLRPAAARLWGRQLCAWTAGYHPGCPSQCPALSAWCALRSSPRARPCPPLSGLRPSLHVSSLRASAPLSVPLPPHPSPAALAASPRLRPRRTHGERGPAQRWLPGGRRAWAEPGGGGRVRFMGSQRVGHN